MLIRSGIYLVKYGFSVNDGAQGRRFQDRIRIPTKRWKLSPMDIESRKHWSEYSRAKDRMFAATRGRHLPGLVFQRTIEGSDLGLEVNVIVGVPVIVGMGAVAV